LAFEGFSTAGSEGAYIFHTLGADADVLDAAAASPTPGDVLVAVLSRTGDGAASFDLCATVAAKLTPARVRPVTDIVAVISASILSYSVRATLTLLDGLDDEAILQSAQEAMQAYASKSHRLGRKVTRSGIYAALHRPGVQSVNLIQPIADLAVAWNQAAHCTGVTLTLA
jgi:phage-related baseplate assembly protein